MVDPVTAISVGSTILGGLFGKKKDKPSEQKSGYQAAPADVREAMEETYLPMLMDNLQKQFRPVPMARAEAPTGSPFDNPELYGWQQWSDAMGGYFSPMNPSPAPAPSAPAAPAITPDMVAGMMTYQNLNNDPYNLNRNALPNPLRGMNLKGQNLSNDDYTFLGRLTNAPRTYAGVNITQDIMKGLDKAKLNPIIAQFVGGY